MFAFGRKKDKSLKTDSSISSTGPVNEKESKEEKERRKREKKEAKKAGKHGKWKKSILVYTHILYVWFYSQAYCDNW